MVITNNELKEKQRNTFEEKGDLPRVFIGEERES